MTEAEIQSDNRTLIKMLNSPGSVTLALGILEGWNGTPEFKKRIDDLFYTLKIDIGDSQFSQLSFFPTASDLVREWYLKCGLMNT